jgi:hypothetical protein
MVVAGLKMLAMIFTQFLWCLSIGRDLETALWIVAGVLTTMGWWCAAEWVRWR